MEHHISPKIQRPHWAWFVVLDGSLAFLALIVICPPLAARIRKSVPIGSNSALRKIFLAAILIHLAEGAVAGALARKKGLSSGDWAIQTTIVGFPSLLALAAQKSEKVDF